MSDDEDRVNSVYFCTIQFSKLILLLLFYLLPLLFFPLVFVFTFSFSLSSSILDLSWEMKNYKTKFTSIDLEIKVRVIYSVISKSLLTRKTVSCS